MQEEYTGSGRKRLAEEHLDSNSTSSDSERDVSPNISSSRSKKARIQEATPAVQCSQGPSSEICTLELEEHKKLAEQAGDAVVERHREDTQTQQISESLGAEIPRSFRSQNDGTWPADAVQLEPMNHTHNLTQAEHADNQHDALENEDRRRKKDEKRRLLQQLKMIEQQLTLVETAQQRPDSVPAAGRSPPSAPHATSNGVSSRPRASPHSQPSSSPSGSFGFPESSASASASRPHQFTDRPDFSKAPVVPSASRKSKSPPTPPPTASATMHPYPPQSSQSSKDPDPKHPAKTKQKSRRSGLGVPWAVPETPPDVLSSVKPRRTLKVPSTLDGFESALVRSESGFRKEIPMYTKGKSKTGSGASKGSKKGRQSVGLFRLSATVPPERLESQQMEEELKFCKQLLKQIRRSKSAWPFLEPVDPVKLGIPDYFDIITKPMDLTTVQKRLDNKMYANAQDVAADIRLTFMNSIRYNPPGNHYHVMAQTMLDEFDSKFAQIKDVRPPKPREPSRSQGPIITQDMLKQQVMAAVEETLQKVGRSVGKPNRAMSKEEKQALGESINKLSEDKLGHVLKIINQAQPLGDGKSAEEGKDDDEIEIDLDKLDNDTLRKLERYVNTCLKHMGLLPAKRRPSKGPGQAGSNSANDSLQHEPGASDASALASSSSRRPIDEADPERRKRASDKKNSSSSSSESGSDSDSDDDSSGSESSSGSAGSANRPKSAARPSLPSQDYQWQPAPHAASLNQAAISHAHSAAQHDPPRRSSQLASSSSLLARPSSPSSFPRPATSPPAASPQPSPAPSPISRSPPASAARQPLSRPLLELDRASAKRYREQMQASVCLDDQRCASASFEVQFKPTPFPAIAPALLKNRLQLDEDFDSIAPDALGA